MDYEAKKSSQMIQKIDYAHTALLVVDVQNDFMPWGALPVEGGDQIIPYIRQLFMLPFETKIAAADWHPIGHCSFASRWDRQVGEKVLINDVEQMLWPDHCVQESWGASYVAGLIELPFDRVFRKGFEKDIDSYSAFFNAQAHSSTGLDNYLKELHITTLVVTGLTLEYCVFTTVEHALHLGYSVIVIEEAVAALERNSSVAKTALEQMGAIFISLARFLEHVHILEQAHV